MKGVFFAAVGLALTARSGLACPDTCFGNSCEDFTYTCEVLETVYGCDCAGCSTCSPPLYEVGPFTDAADFADWVLDTSMGAAILTYSSTYESMQLKSTAAGFSAATYTVPGDTSSVTAFQVEAVFLARSLETTDTCMLDLSTNGGSTWTNAVTIVNGQDKTSDPATVYDEEVVAGSMSLTVRLSLDADSGSDRCHLRYIKITATTEVIPFPLTLYQLGPIASESDFSEWALDETNGAATLLYGLDGMQIKSDGAGTSHVTHTIPAQDSSYFEVNVTLRGRSLEGSDTCEFSVSTDAGTTWQDPIGTVVNNQDRSTDPDLEYIALVRSEGSDLMVRLSNVAGDALDRCVLLYLTVTGLDEATPLYTLGPITSAADFADWTAAGPGTLKYGVAFPGMQLISTAAGTSTATHSLVADTSVFDYYEVNVTMVARSLESTDECQFVVSMDDGATFGDALATLVNGEDTDTEFDFQFLLSRDDTDGLSDLRLANVAGSDLDRCLIRTLAVGGITA